MPAEFGHEPVLVHEVIRLLDPKPGEVAVDCTVGRGGHAAAIARQLGPRGHLVGIDADPANVRAASDRLRGIPNGPATTFIRDSFAAVPVHLARLRLRADILLADLGFASTQMADPARGFSFAADGPLDMRLDPGGAVTAADLLATLPEGELAELIGRLGEEPLARRIARKLAQTREGEPIESTAQLARLVMEAYGPRARHSRLHPATRTFMALRIAVNDELGALRGLLDAARRGVEAAGRRGGAGPDSSDWLNRGARIAIISFHSLEDRLVKQAMADWEHAGWAHRLTRRPITPSDEETAANPSARSAKLRAVKVDGPTRTPARTLSNDT